MKKFLAKYLRLPLWLILIIWILIQIILFIIMGISRNIIVDIFAGSIIAVIEIGVILTVRSKYKKLNVENSIWDIFNQNLTKGRKYLYMLLLPLSLFPISAGIFGGIVAAILGLAVSGWSEAILAFILFIPISIFWTIKIINALLPFLAPFPFVYAIVYLGVAAYTIWGRVNYGDDTPTLTAGFIGAALGCLILQGIYVFGNKKGK